MSSCLESLYRIQRLLKSGPMRVWRMSHYHDVCEVEQAADLGWVRIFSRESRRGLPVRMAELSGRADAVLITTNGRTT